MLTICSINVLPFNAHIFSFLTSSFLDIASSPFPSSEPNWYFSNVCSSVSISTLITPMQSPIATISLTYPVLSPPFSSHFSILSADKSYLYINLSLHIIRFCPLISKTALSNETSLKKSCNLRFISSFLFSSSLS